MDGGACIHGVAAGKDLAAGRGPGHGVLWAGRVGVFRHAVGGVIRRYKLDLVGKGRCTAGRGRSPSES